jgi:rhodanese-related sulfurtransferase
MEFMLDKLQKSSLPSPPSPSLSLPPVKNFSPPSPSDISSSLEDAAKGLTGSFENLSGSLNQIKLGDTLNSSAADAAGALTGAASNAAAVAGGAVESASKLTGQAAAELTNSLDNVQKNVGSLVGELQSAIGGVADQAASQMDAALASILSQLPPEVKDGLTSAAALVSTTVQHQDPKISAAVASIPIFLLLKAIYGGFSGFVSPRKAFDILQSQQDALIVDIRTEAIRLQNGLPELRRGALGKGTPIPPLELPPSVRKQVRNAGQLAIDILGTQIAGLARVNASTTKIIIMDQGQGDRFAKQVARAAAAAGARRTYIMTGGFKAWQAEGLPVATKATTYEAGPLAAVADSAEVALETATGAIKSNPLAGSAAAAGFLALLVALYNYHLTLRFIGVVGLELTILNKLLSYDSPEEFFNDASMVLSAAGGVAGTALSAVESASPSSGAVAGGMAEAEEEENEGEGDDNKGAVETNGDEAPVVEA